MIPKELLVSAALSGMLAAGLATDAGATSVASADKCYGVAKAGQNSCASATGVHSCAGKAEIDDDPGDFVPLVPADCLKEGGKTTPPPAPKEQDQ